MEQYSFGRHMVRNFSRVVPMLLFPFILAVVAFPEFFGQPQLTLKFRLALLALLGVVMAMFLFEYLQGSRSTDYDAIRTTVDPTAERLLYELRNFKEEYRVDADTSGLREEVSELRNLLKNQRGQLSEFTQAERGELIGALQAQLSATLGDEFIKSIDRRYATIAIKNSRHESMVRDFEILRQRLLEEVRALQRRANSNLAIGSITTLLAMSSLAFVVLRATPDFHSTASVASYYLPRITFVIFIEVFAFFFLRLYKVSLDDIKFYQNELTNIESRLIALRAALVDENQGGLAKILGELAVTERNFVLKKGETTVDLERRKLDAAGDHAVLQHVTGLVEKLKPRA